MGAHCHHQRRQDRTDEGELKPALSEHPRSPLKKNHMDDVIVIGAGVIGCSAALNLARLGLHVQIVDSAPPGSGCSFGNAGIIAVDHVAPLASPQTVAGIPRMLMERDGPLRLNKLGVPRMTPWMLRFVAQSAPSNFRRNTESLASLVTGAAEAWRRLIDSAVISRETYRDTGALYVFERPEKAEAQRRNLEVLDRFQIEYQELTAKQVRDDYLPALTRDISHARFMPGMSSVANPQRIVQSLFEAARAAGTTFSQARVTDPDLLPDGSVRVHASETTLTARKVLIAAGARSGQLTARFGVKIPLTNERGYHVELLEPPAEHLRVPSASSNGASHATRWKTAYASPAR
jgi:D-hydroxyproline dehydrogenase